MLGLALSLLLVQGDSTFERYRLTREYEHRIGREQAIEVGALTLNYKATAFLTSKSSRGSFFEPAEWASGSGIEQLLKRLPPPDFERSQASLVCQLEPDGRLNACRVGERWPTSSTWTEAATRLAEGLQTTTRFAQAYSQRTRLVALDLEVQHPGGKQAEGCIIAFCEALDMPPPQPRSTGAVPLVEYRIDGTISEGTETLDGVEHDLAGRAFTAVFWVDPSAATNRAHRSYIEEDTAPYRSGAVQGAVTYPRNDGRAIHQFGHSGLRYGDFDKQDLDGDEVDTLSLEAGDKGTVDNKDVYNGALVLSILSFHRDLFRSSRIDETGIIEGFEGFAFFRRKEDPEAGAELVFDRMMVRKLVTGASGGVTDRDPK